MQKQVLVTGMGLFSSLSCGDASEHFNQLLRGESGCSRAQAPVNPDFPYQLQAPVKGFQVRDWIRSRMLRKVLPRSAAMCVAAAGQALRDANLEGDFQRLETCGLYVGSVQLDIEMESFLPAVHESMDAEGQFDMSRFARRGMHLVDPLFLVKALPNAGLGGIAVEYQATGPNLNITNGPVSGLQAVAAAAAAIQRGEIQVAVAGGYDSLLQMENIMAHLLAGRLSASDVPPQQACRPFDENRQGYVPGEGAAFVVLESAAHARQRSARVYGEVLGYAHTTAAESRTTDDGAVLGLEQAARASLDQGQCSAIEVDALFGCGLGVEEDDLYEAAVLRRLSTSHPIAFTSATGSLGYTEAASGGFALINALLAMQKNVIPPMINCDQPDDRCSGNFIRRAEVKPLRRTLAWSTDRGIKNVCVLLGQNTL
ncbi:MAG: beta-ketoacyl synthase N-terminal-like domain-containing protein [Gammaproteobacteria bacterium]|jgi:3-oxoacyl-[acyl-carrier-protein] synthase II